MSGRIAAILKDLGITLPTPALPQASYLPWVRTGALLFISGQITMGAKGLEYMGIVGDDINLEDAKRAARLAGINVIAQAAAALERGGATVAATGTDTLTASGLAAEKIVTLLGAEAVPFSEVSAHRATLEEAYMELTRDAVEYRAEPARGAAR